MFDSNLDTSQQAWGRLDWQEGRVGVPSRLFALAFLVAFLVLCLGSPWLSVGLLFELLITEGWEQFRSYSVTGFSCVKPMERKYRVQIKQGWVVWPDKQGVWQL